MKEHSSRLRLTIGITGAEMATLNDFKCSCAHRAVNLLNLLIHTLISVFSVALLQMTAFWWCSLETVAQQQRQGINQLNQSYLWSVQIPGATVTTEEVEQLQHSLKPLSWQTRPLTRIQTITDVGSLWRMKPFNAGMIGHKDIMYLIVCDNFCLSSWKTTSFYWPAEAAEDCEVGITERRKVNTPSSGAARCLVSRDPTLAGSTGSIWSEIFNSLLCFPQ